MSDTPRTDQAEAFDDDGRMVSASFARTLERETISLHAELAEQVRQHEITHGMMMAAKAELAEARKGLLAVETLINESRGVYGLHQNDDPAPWSELRTGGRFEYWLTEFDRALECLRKGAT